MTPPGRVDEADHPTLRQPGAGMLTVLAGAGPGQAYGTGHVHVRDVALTAVTVTVRVPVNP
jgi:hypothetical protein